MNSFKLESLNFELTTECPLKCPQCYCTLHPGRHLNLNTALYWIDEAAKNNVSTLNLSGGETLCYPYLYEVISYASQKKINCNVALSGYLFDQDSFSKLISAGVSGIFISLNGSTEEINEKSRKGYKLAINALELLNANSYHRTTINWVMQSSNADDFENMIDLAEKHKVSRLVVMCLKPDSKNDLSNRPNHKQMLRVCNYIRKYRGLVDIRVESCFSQMLALLGQSFLYGNLNIGIDKGCTAGLLSANVNVDGLLSPCRHLYYFEKWNSLSDYWEQSSILNIIRSLDQSKHEPCKGCAFAVYCRHCLANNSNVTDELFIGDKTCPLASASVGY